MTLTLLEQESLKRTRLLPSLPEGIPQEYATYSQVFIQENFDQFLLERPWDHAIKLVEGAPKSISAKIYPLSPAKMEAVENS